MAKSRIIVVANQKGGVGKSSVCISLANYLAGERKILVGAIYDSDPQQSIVHQREKDLKNAEGTPIQVCYPVKPLELGSTQRISALISDLRNEQGYFIFDTPGRIDNNGGVKSLLAVADYILVPFSYDNLTLRSTIEFMLYWDTTKKKVREQTGYELEGKLVFVPCRIDGREGTMQEKANWVDVMKLFQEAGHLLPALAYRANMKRFDTVNLSKEQKDTVANTYEKLIEITEAPPQSSATAPEQS